MKKKFLKLSLITVFIWICSSYAFSAEKLVIVTEQYDPYEYLQNGKWVGLDAETVIEMGKRAGIEVVIKEYPWARCLDMMKNGSADAIISLMKSPERETFMAFPDVNISEERNVIFSKKNYSKKVARLSDLTGETVGTVRGYEYPGLFMKASNFKKDESTSSAEMMKKFSGGRFNLMILNELVGYSQIPKDVPEIKNNIKVVLEVGKDPMYIAFSKKSKNAVKLFPVCNNILKEMKKDGTIDKNRRKYSK